MTKSESTASSSDVEHDQNQSSVNDWDSADTAETESGGVSKETETGGDEAVVAAEVVEEGEVKPVEEVDALSTFSEQEGRFSFRVLPIIQRNATAWTVNVYAEGVQGPVLQTRDEITDEQADTLGMKRRLQERINDALDYANRELDVPPELRGQERDHRSLHELEVMMEKEA